MARGLINCVSFFSKFLESFGCIWGSFFDDFLIDFDPFWGPWGTWAPPRRPKGSWEGFGIIFGRILASFWHPLEVTFLTFWDVFLMSFFDMLLESIFYRFLLDFGVGFRSFFEHF